MGKGEHKSRRFLTLMLAGIMMAWAIPYEYAYGETTSAEGSSSSTADQSEQLNERTEATGSEASDVPESVPNQVLVRYKAGSVDTEKPTQQEKKAAQEANVASTFGDTMGESSDAEGQKAENTLGQQAEILEDSLSDHYEIQDTVTFDAASKKEDETVISVVSSDKYSTDTLVEKLEENSDVAAAEPNYVVHALSETDGTESTGSSWNDEYLSSAWQLNEINASSGWSDYDQSSTKSDKDVVAVVLDTGVNYDHEDLKSHMWTKPDNFGIQESGKYGINLVEYRLKDGSAEENIQDPMDENGHGTHCAGIIAAEANNSCGSAGVFGADKSSDFSGIKVLAIRVLDQDGYGLNSWILKGFYYVNQYAQAGVNIKVVNCSLGDDRDCSIYQSLFDEMGKSGILVSLAAGNSGSDNDSGSMSPANTASDYAVTVASGDEGGTLSSYSCYGKRNVDILAPGSNILSTVCKDRYIPWRYTADKVKSTTSCYGEFDDDTEIENNQITPSGGTDPDGTDITGVNTFGTGKLVKNLSSESKAKATLSVNKGTSGQLTAAQQKSSLQLKISNAKAGDQFVLYFPYDKSEKESSSNTYADLLYNISCDGDMMGEYAYGDVGVQVGSTESTSDTFQNLQLSDYWKRNEDSGSYKGDYTDYSYAGISSLYKSLWRGSPSAEVLMTQSEENRSGYEYGLGLVFIADKDGSVTINLGSLGVSKAVTGTDSGDSLKDTSSFGKYDLYSGTSMAAPVVTGCIALIAAMNPDADAKELKALLFQSVESKSSLANKVSTGGEVDLSQYASPSSESGKPALTGATVDVKADTVTIQGSGFRGDALTVTAKNRTTGKSSQISGDDISAESSSLTIRNASSNGLIGRDITFTINNGTQTGEGSFYLVKGESTYNKEFQLTLDDDAEDASMKDSDQGSKAKIIVDVDDDTSLNTNGIKWISNDRMILGQDSATGEIYRVDKEGFHHLGKSSGVEDQVWDYAEAQAESKDKTTAAKWSLSDDENYEVHILSNATYYNGTVYELVGCNIGEKHTAYVLMGMDVTAGSPKWRIISATMESYRILSCSQETGVGITLGNIDGKLYAVGGVDFENSIRNTDSEGDYISGTIYGSKEVYSYDVKSGGSWSKESELPFEAYGGTAIQWKDKLYYLLGRKGAKTDRGINCDILEFDGTKWSTVGTLPTVINQSVETIGWGEGVISTAIGIDSQGILLGGASTDGYGDTYRFNPESKKLEPLYYTAWDNAQTHKASGMSVGNKFYFIVSDETFDEDSPDSEDGDFVLTVSSVSIGSPYQTLATKKSGKGSGTISGAGTMPTSGKTTVVITPSSGSYIYSYSISGYGISKSYGKPTATSKAAQRASLTLTKGGTVNVTFGKICTKVTINKKSLKLKRKKSYKLSASANGTNSKVSWKVSNKKYAKVTSSGKVTIKKKAKKGKTVTVTATSKENSKLKAKCKIKIK